MTFHDLHSDVKMFADHASLFSVTNDVDIPASKLNNDSI